MYIWKKQDRRSMALLTIMGLIAVCVITRGEFLFGSSVDWVNQHSVLPDYFRRLFYETGELFPEFAPHLGGGQNLFCFSYYGFLSPIILPSYLLPGVSMTTYIAVSSILLLLMSVNLCFAWLRYKGFDEKVAFVSSFLFLCSAALLYHSHKQIMFVNYMPFVFLALFGCERYFEKKKSGLLILSVFLMIMTSYFYSVGGLLMLFIYGIYRRQRLDVRYLLRLAIPVGMSALLIFPSLMAILGGRGESSGGINLQELLLPAVKLESFLYSPYGMGLTAISVLALIRLPFRGKREEKILFWCLLVLFLFPVFLYLLNGGLYVRGKVFLPFLPLMIYCVALFLQELQEEKLVLKKRRFLIYVVAAAGIGIADHTWFGLAFTAEALLVLGSIYYGGKRHSFWTAVASSCLCSLLVCIGVNSSDVLVGKEQAAELVSEDKQKLFQFLEEYDTSLYRVNDLTNTRETCNQVLSMHAYRTSLYSSTYQKDYNSFHAKSMANGNISTNNIARLDSPNLLFQTFMGVRYLIAEKEQEVPNGYQVICEAGNYRLYENPTVFPLVYGNSSTLSEKTYAELQKTEQVAALLEYTIVAEDSLQRDSGTEYARQLTEREIELPLKKTEKGEGYCINSTEAINLTIPFTGNPEEDIVLLEWSFFETPEEDIIISAGNVANRLSGENAMYPNGNDTFSFVLSNSKKALPLSFSAGDYDIFGLRCYTMPLENVLTASKKLTAMREETGLGVSGTILSGKIELLEDGYLVTSIPYDKGFTLYVNGEKQKTEKVNLAFLGARLAAGEYEIELVYHAPMFAAGCIISAGSFLILIAVAVWEWRRKKSN